MISESEPYVHWQCGQQASGFAPIPLAKQQAATKVVPVEREQAAQRLRELAGVPQDDVNDPFHPRYIEGYKKGHAAGRRRAAPQPASVSNDTLYLLRRLLSNQHTLTGPEFRAELEKIVGEAYQQGVQEPYGYVFAEQYAPIVGSELKTTREVFTRVKPDRQCLALYTAPQPEAAPLHKAVAAAAVTQSTALYNSIVEKRKAKAKHPDDAAVDRFAEAMKQKLSAARAKGRGGWDTPECTQQLLSDMLREHVGKGDPRDVANFCMFLWCRGEAIAAAPQPAPAPRSEREEIAMIDAAMVEMANIVPPLKRSECARLINAALKAQGENT